MLLEIEKRQSRIDNPPAWPGPVLAGSIAQVKQRYKQLKNRHGPRYTYAMVTAAFLTLFLPVPAISLVSVALIVVIAEIHRAIAKRGGFSNTIAKELVMSINCDVILKPSATPAQLSALGTALWSWCPRAARGNRTYQFLDNQALADLIAGEFPASSQGGPRGIHFMTQDEVSPDRQSAVDSLRRTIPCTGVADIVVDGKSWNLVR